MNAIGVRLGNGWYSQEQNILPAVLKPTYGKMSFCDKAENNG